MNRKSGLGNQRSGIAPPGSPGIVSAAGSRLSTPDADDTIAAISTPLGRGAIALLRLSGLSAYMTAARVLSPWRSTPREVYRAALSHPDTGVLIDQALVTVYAAPRSYTGEDIVELSVHGGFVTPALALAALLAAGAREALAGEFTRRAVMNGKLDVLQAEGVADLVDARSRAMHGAALAQLEGGLSRRIAALRETLLHLEALIAYDIDFPEEDDGPVGPERIAVATTDLLAAIDALLATAHTGEVVRAGALVVIAGAPNVGKSSLFNALLGYARAIVTDVPGTTRDALEAVLDVGDWPVRLIDTAGLRETADVVERLGIEVSERYLADADLILACGDDPTSLGTALTRLHALGPASVLPVLTKADRGAVELAAFRYESGPGPALESSGYHIPSSGNHSDPGSTGLPQNMASLAAPAACGIAQASLSASAAGQPLRVSAHTGEGLRELTGRIAARLAALHGARTVEVPLLTRERHERAVQVARDEVARFAESWHQGELPVTVVAVHLHAAAAALESLVGTVDVEDVLDRVFASFCVGK